MHAERRHAGQVALQDDRADRVAERDDRHRRDRTDTGALCVDADDRRDSDEAEGEPDHALGPSRSRAPVVRTISAVNERHRRDQEAGQRARDALLGDPEQHPRDRDLDRGEHEQRPPVREERTQLARAAPRSAAEAAAAIPVRARTSIAGLSSLTATLIRRYGIPQITHIAAKSIHPRLLMATTLRIPSRPGACTIPSRADQLRESSWPETG